MADFQKTVALTPAVGVPGAYASINPIISTAKGYIAATTVTIGGFVWEDTTYAGQVNSSGSGAPLGFACREVTNPLAYNAVYANTVPAGEAVSVQVAGDFWATPTANVTKGNKVFANTSNGTLKGGSAGATVSSHVETNFVWLDSVNSGEIGRISCYGNTQAIPPTDLSSYSKTADTVSAVVAGDSNYEIKVTKGGTTSTVEIGHA